MTLTARHELETNVVTPTVRTASRKYLYWAVAAVVVVALGVISLIVTGGAQSFGASLSPTDASPGGSKAIAEVLRKQGVSVATPSTMRETRTAVTDPDTTTIIVIDDYGYLTDDALEELTELSSHLIIMTPTFDQLDVVAPEVAHAGSVHGTVEADCALPFVERAGSVDGTGSGFRVIGSGADATQCFSSGDDVYSLVQVRHGDNRVTVVGTRDAFANDTVQFHGNAAYALGLLGETPNLVWLLPTIDEAPGAGGATAAELTPVWVSSVMLLLLLAAIAAGFWRGRRFGPLVVESLPVVVRASETMHGRARLYQKSADHLHTLDALRVGTIDRLGVLCGLPTMASVDDVLRAVANITGQQAAHVTHLLRDATPSSETELIQLSDALLNLEAATANAIHPSSATMDTTATTTRPEG